MKKYIPLFAVVATAFVCASCSSNDSDENTTGKSDEKVAMTFSVNSISENAETRTYMYNYDATAVETSHSVFWNSSDKVAVIETTHSTGDEFSISNFTSNSNSATFTGKSYNGSNHIIVYPASAFNSYNVGESKVTITVPASQTATNNSFDPKACVQAGIISNNGTGAVDIKNATAIMYIQLEKNANIKYSAVTLQTSNYKFVGTAPATVNSSGVTIDGANITSGSNMVTLSGESQFFEGGTYMMCIIPSSSYPSMEVQITYQIGSGNIQTQVRKFTLSNVQLVAGRMYSLGKFGLNSEGTKLEFKSNY